MSILALLQSFQPLLPLLLVLFAPSIYRRLLPFVRPGAHAASPSPRRGLPQPRHWPTTLKVLLAVNSAYHIFSLFSTPYDVFTSHSLPIFTSNERLRSAVLFRPTSPDDLYPSKLESASPLLELLLQKLQVADNRYLYARFGHQVMLNCIWCSNINDYLLSSLPSVLSGYLVQMVLAGSLGLEAVSGPGATRKAERWRSTFGWAVGLMCIGEFGVRYLWELRAVNGDCVHLSPTLHTIRHIIFLFLPIVYALVPMPSSPDPSSVLQALSTAQNTIRLSSLARAASTRDPILRQVLSAAADEDTRVSWAARNDEAVQRDMKDFRLNPQEIRSSAGRWVRDGWNSLVRRGDVVS